MNDIAVLPNKPPCAELTSTILMIMTYVKDPRVLIAHGVRSLIFGCSHNIFDVFIIKSLHLAKWRHRPRRIGFHSGVRNYPYTTIIIID